MQKFRSYLIDGLLVCLSLFVLYTAVVGPLVAMRQRAVVYMVSLFLIFLTVPFRKGGKTNWFDTILAVVGMGSGLYVLVFFNSLVNRMGAPNQVDLVLGGLAILLTLEATRRSIGWPLPTVTSLFILYALLGHKLPGTFGHRGYDVDRIINQMYLTTEGIFGVPLGVMTSIVFLFVLFGAFLSRSGGGNFFINLAVSLAGKAKGGPAKIAVFASGFLGTISGSSIANVVTTGSFTIPLMKRVGYRPEFAGAVEAAASTGGQIMPPIMGAAAFIMAEFTGIPYIAIIAAALIPGILYYFSLYMNVHLEACKQGLRGMEAQEVPRLKQVLKEGWHYFIPLAAIIGTLIYGYSPNRAAYTAIALLIMVSMFRASTRMKIKDIIDSLKEGSDTAVSIVSATACAGIIVGIVNMTGLALKFSTVVTQLAAGLVLPALLLTMVASIVLGMSLPTTANYIVQAAITAPVLIKLGVPVMTAHLFVLYFGVFADITPPVALAAYAASGISRGDPMKTGLLASRSVVIGFLIPFLFVYFPALLGNAPAREVAAAVITAVMAVVALSAGLVGFLQRECLWWERLVLLAAGGMLLVPEHLSDTIGGIILILVYLWQRFKPLGSEVFSRSAS
ncbi:MAG: TRAP transporter permease [Bacillota bacterium]